MPRYPGHIKSQTKFTRIVNFQQGKCWFCGLTMGADCTREHLLARALGGGDEDGNIKAAHSECNSAAGSLSVAKKYRLRDIAHKEGRGEMLMMAKRMRRADARAAFQENYSQSLANVALRDSLVKRAAAKAKGDK